MVEDVHVYLGKKTRQGSVMEERTEKVSQEGGTGGCGGDHGDRNMERTPAVVAEVRGRVRAAWGRWGAPE